MMTHTRTAAPDTPADSHTDPGPTPRPTPRPSVPAELFMDQTSILVISANKGINRMVSHALQGERGARVTSRTASLIDMADGKTGGSVASVNRHDIIVFDLTGAPGEMAALARLTRSRGQGTHYLAMSYDTLPLDTARDLVEAGVDHILPLRDIRPDLLDVADLRPAIAQAEARRTAPQG